MRHKPYGAQGGLAMIVVGLFFLLVIYSFKGMWWLVTNICSEIHKQVTKEHPSTKNNRRKR